jgi:N-acyl amino acid synthase of PEP-CTERM/exosortase system
MSKARFEIRRVTPGSSDYENYLSLRHAIFCEELGRVPLAAATDGAGRPLESDCFDPYSMHLSCVDLQSGNTVACGRLILPNPLGLNVTRRYLLEYKKPAHIVGEISRLAIATPMRRRRSSQSPTDVPPAEALLEEGGAAAGIRRSEGSEITFLMYRELYHLARAEGLEYCYAAMEDCLGRLLTWLGFPFRPIGPLNRDVAPPRRPFLIGADAMRNRLYQRDPSRFAFMFGAESEVCSGEPAHQAA